MSKNEPLNFQQKEKLLLEKIEKAKEQLGKLKSQRISECGALVIKHGLDQFDLKRLDEAFAGLAKQLAHENA